MFRLFCVDIEPEPTLEPGPAPNQESWGVIPAEAKILGGHPSPNQEAWRVIPPQTSSLGYPSPDWESVGVMPRYVGVFMGDAVACCGRGPHHSVLCQHP